jgi:ribosomal protein L11 methyltransferase
MSMHELAVALRADAVEPAESICTAAGASAITLADAADDAIFEPAPGELRLWPTTVMRALFDSAQNAETALTHLCELPGIAPDRVQVVAVAEQDWERIWLKDWKPLQFGRLWVLPEGFDASQDADAVIVRLDPGLAFGTGTHPTTALCLRAMAKLDLRDRRVIDYGCGSGILGLAAIKLGARCCSAVDLDPQALLACRRNAASNGIADRVTAQLPDARLDAADCLFANILARPLIELAPRLASYTVSGGLLLLSGLLASQAAEVTAAYDPCFHIDELTEQDGWCCLRASRL